jgi:Sulfotransferase family
VTPLRHRRSAVPAPAPFVVGVGRSGTTLLRLMLDAHPELAIPPETHFAPGLIERAHEGAGADALVDEIVGTRAWADFSIQAERLRERVTALEEGGAAAVLRAFYGLCAEREGKPRWGDKTPIYVRSMRPIGGELPEARFVHLIRDGRDVVLSRRARGMGAGKPIADTADRWRRRIEEARTQARRLRGRYLELRYEDLVTRPEPQLRRVCELIELDYDAAMLDYHKRAGGRLAELGDLPAEGGRRGRASAERQASHALAAGPPTSARTGAWREQMSSVDRAEFEAVAGGLLVELGYEVPSS